MKRSLKFRILSRLFIIISIIFLVLSATILVVISNILRFSLESRGKDDMQLLSYYIKDAQEDAEQASKILAINEEVQNFLIREQKPSVSDEVASVRSMMSSIEKSVLLQDYVQSFCIVSNLGRGYWNTSPNSNDFVEWFEDNALGGESVLEFRGFTDSYVFPVTINSSRPVRLVSYVCPVRSVTRDHQLTVGRIIINLNFDQLIYKLKNQSSIFSQIAILNQEKELLYLSSGDEDAFMQAASGMSVNSQRRGENWYISQYIPSSDWYLVTAADMSQSINFIQGSYVVAGILIMLFIVLCIPVCLYPLLNNISVQIRDLSNAIDQVRLGSLDTTIHLGGSSELTNISEGFNLMTVSIKDHIRKSVEETERSQKLSFELLVAKINPHFIYNTLNSIIYLARKEKSQDIIQMTSAFIYLLQDSIHLGNSPLYARCENEAEVIRQYIIIQKYRYRGRFDFSLECQPELKGYYIPRNILQPLVENSLIHGICTDDKPGAIILIMKKLQDYMEIVLQDNGVGMDQEYADGLLLSAADTDADRRARVRPIGINNIAGRLNYLFPGCHDFLVKSQVGKGTAITIHIPLVADPDERIKQ